MEFAQNRKNLKHRHKQTELEIYIFSDHKPRLLLYAINVFKGHFTQPNIIQLCAFQIWSTESGMLIKDYFVKYWTVCRQNVYGICRK